jgi:DNA processing protein
MSNLKYWLALSSVESLGSKRARELAARFGSVEALFSASVREIISRGRLNPLIAQRLLEAKQKLDSFELAVTSLKSKDRIECCCLDDEAYPKLLRLIDDPPLVLYKKGELLDFKLPAIAIVGTRRPSPIGVETARILARHFANLGFTVVSGLASGIDASAHEGALEAKGKTLAVLGCGLKFIYPKVNIPLAEAITSKESLGALISEVSPYEPVSSSNLVRRNRLISGLSLATIVVQTEFDRGSLHAARFAIAQSRRLYACSFNTHEKSEKSIEAGEAAHDINPLLKLLKLGAKLIKADPLEAETLAEIADDLEHLNLNGSDPKTQNQLQSGRKLQGELFRV